jgi:hypothetical protein
MLWSKWINSRVVVPIRFVSEVLGATVNASAKDGATYVDISFKP